MLKKLWHWQDVAAHEAGHAIVASTFPRVLRVLSVSIDADHHGAWVGITRFAPVFRHYNAFVAYATLVNAMAGLAGETIGTPLSLMEMLIPSSSPNHDRNHAIDRVQKLRQFSVAWRGYVRVAERLPFPYRLLVVRPLSWNLRSDYEMSLVILLALAHARRIIKRRRKAFEQLESSLRRHHTIAGDRLDEILGQSLDDNHGD